MKFNQNWTQKTTENEEAENESKISKKELHCVGVFTLIKFEVEQNETKHPSS